MAIKIYANNASAIPINKDFIKGDDGGYYIPSVEDGTLSWTPSEEGMPTIAAAFIKGEKGDKGDKGDTGEQGLKGNTGDTGESGVFIGSTAPTDSSIKVWINPEATPNTYITEEEARQIVNEALGVIENGSY